ncbi:MAG: RING-H2 finger protein [Zetaproteobacteria bacterium]|nr:RING-H2 finger protein [Zetaproteobacteria bacterium]
MLTKKFILGLCLMASLSNTYAEDGPLAKVLSFRQDLLDHKYDVHQLRDGSDLVTSDKSEAQLDGEWFREVDLKMNLTQRRIQSLFHKIEQRQRSPQQGTVTPQEIKLLSLLVTPIRYLYLHIQHQKKDLRRYYEKKLAQKQSNLLNKMRLSAYVQELRHYNEITIIEIENRLEDFQQRLLMKTENLGALRHEQLEAICTKLDHTDIAAEHRECMVCLEEMHSETSNAADPQAELWQLPCKHGFHKSCVLEWLDTHNTCPTCRQEVVTQP